MNRILLILSLLLSISSTAQNKKSLLRTGNDLYTDSSYNQAEIQYRKSLEKDQDYFPASYNLANAIYKQERFEESSALFDGLKNNTKEDKELATIYHNLGNSLLKHSNCNYLLIAQLLLKLDHHIQLILLEWNFLTTIP